MYLRTKFKHYTGNYPCFSRDYDNTGHLRGEDVTPQYGEWLEQIFYDGNKERYLRSEYVRDTGEKYAVVKRNSNTDSMYWYMRGYVLWLEEFVLRSKLFELD